MTQTRFIEYKAPVNSFPLSEARAGIIPYGRYRGFDTMAQGDGTAIAIEISHESTGIKYTGEDNEPLSNFQGCVISRHGTVLYVDETLEFTVDANSSGSDRYDLVYMEYSWAQIEGGSVATFGLVKGTPGAGIPAVPDTKIGVEIGTVKVPAGATIFADLEWIPWAIPDLGDQDIIENHPALDERYAIKSEPNTFTDYNIFQKIIEQKFDSVVGLTVVNNELVVGRGGNTILVVDNSPITATIRNIVPEAGSYFQVGTKLTLFFLISGSVVTLGKYNNPTSGFYGPPFQDKILVTYDVCEFTYLGEFMGGGSGNCWLITNPGWSMSKEFYTPTPIYITNLLSFPGGGDFTAGNKTPIGRLIGCVKYLSGNITGPEGAALARESDVQICILPESLRPSILTRVSVQFHSTYRSGHPTTIFSRQATIAPNGYVTIMAGATADLTDLYFTDDPYAGVFLDGVSYI